MKQALLMMILTGILSFIIGYGVSKIYKEFTFDHVIGTSIGTAIGNLLVWTAVALFDIAM